MSNVLTIAEIETQFASEWVLVEDPQTNDALEVQSGKVLYHSKDRDEVYREAVRLRPKHFAIRYLLVRGMCASILGLGLNTRHPRRHVPACPDSSLPGVESSTASRTVYL
jgi:hypothetical protein